ncbi:MAG: hypothetical protein AAFP19_03840, partial [Bacteroidota bacterium]
SQSPWFGAVPDIDPNPAIPLNYVKTGAGEIDNNLDPDQQLSTIGDGFFVPYSIIDFRSTAGQPPYVTPAWINSTNDIVRVRNPLSRLNNVDVVLTPDKSKWSRCVVVETASPFYYDPNSGLGIPTEGEARQFDPRQVPSVTADDNDGNGLPDEDTNESRPGFGWFPGYAVDVETGERLNIFFGENSTYNGILAEPEYDTPFIGGDSPATGGKMLGNDMMWNPSSQGLINTGTPTIYNALIGGQQFMYVTRQPYDECEFIYDKLAGSSFQKVNALEQVTWAAIPLLATGQQMRSYAEGLVPHEVVIKLRVDNAYEVSEGTGVNNGYPTYQFSLEGKATSELSTQTEIDAALAAINVVPNPYYGYSSYETSQFTNIVRITNLPPQCTVTIFTLDGKFIRQYKRDEAGIPQNTRSNPGILETQFSPDIEWDLENNKGIPVASGVYLIHVDAPGLGERVIKWFGVGRQFDPSGL